MDWLFALLLQVWSLLLFLVLRVCYFEAKETFDMNLGLLKEISLCKDL